MSQCRWLVCLRAAFQDWSALLPIMSMIIRIFLRPERSNTIHFSFSQTCFKVQHLPQVKYFVAIKLTRGYNILICGHTLLRNYHCVYVHITCFFVHLRIYLFFAQIWSIHLASEHLDHLVTHTVAVFNDFTTSVSVSSFQFCLNCFPKYQVNHQFPHPPLSFCSSADTRWWRRQWYTSMHWGKSNIQFGSDRSHSCRMATSQIRIQTKTM